MAEIFNGNYRCYDYPDEDAVGDWRSSTRQPRLQAGCRGHEAPPFYRRTDVVPSNGAVHIQRDNRYSLSLF